MEKTMQLKYDVITEGLRFPEGPIIMQDGSIVLVEIERKTLSRVMTDGSIEVIAELGGGPNGAAIGPDGHVYVCNNGGAQFTEQFGLLLSGPAPKDNENGRIEKVNLTTGEVEVLYDHCDGHKLVGPNDIVFDNQGGFYFTDFGKTFAETRTRALGNVYYAKADGSSIVAMENERLSPNGIGLSPDGNSVYFTDTLTASLFAYDLKAPGEPKLLDFPPSAARLVARLPGEALFDSLAVTASGAICVASLVHGGITQIAPDGSYKHYETPDPLTTNICFGGDDMRDAYLTLSGTGKLIKCRWHEPGLPLAYNA